MDGDRPRLLQALPQPAVDPRVEAVLEVLAGAGVPEVSRRWEVDPAILHRWVEAFVDAGSAQITNRPAEASARQRDRFLAAFAHETRTPLSVAQGWATLLHEGAVPQPRVAQTTASLHEALARLAERIQDVELLASASLGRLTPHVERVPAASLVRLLSPPPEVTGEGPEVEVEVDPALFGRLLRDLWDAAASHPEPRDRRLEVHRIGPWVEFRVVRDADPIDPHVLQALFEPFDLNDDGTGVTIGLYLARALAVAHGGTVGVEQDDDGAVLWVRVPQNPGSPDRGRPDLT